MKTAVQRTKADTYLKLLEVIQPPLERRRMGRIVFNPDRPISRVENKHAVFELDAEQVE